MEESGSSAKYSASEWEKIRQQFLASMMQNITIQNLAQNAGYNWPVKDKEDVAQIYVNLSYDELMMMPSIAGQTRKADLLIDILHETIAFDDPFGDMISDDESGPGNAEEILEAFDKLGISHDFPVKLTTLTSETKKLCRDEEIETIGQFVTFSQNMAQSIVIGGDIRAFTNVFAYTDEKAIAKYLPFRPSHKGLHIPEALGMMVNSMRDGTRLFLQKRFGGILSDEEKSKVRSYSEGSELELVEKIKCDMDEIFNFFSEEKEKLAQIANSEESLQRQFIVLDNPNLEKAAIGCIHYYFQGLDYFKGKKGFFGKLFGIFKK